jgi:hypothetical protein
MSIHTSFQYSIDILAIDGETVIEHLAAVEDFCVALATYRAACDRWPGAAIALRQGGRTVEKPIRPPARHVRPFVSASCVRWPANAQPLPVMGGNAVIQGKHNRIPKKRGPIIAVAHRANLNVRPGEEINFSSTGNRIASWVQVVRIRRTIV